MCMHHYTRAIDTGSDVSLLISVKDSGIGLLEAEKSLIFENFSRLERTAGETGTGLGME